VGLLLSSPQWLPTLELQQWSIRSSGLDYQKMIEFSLPPLQGLTLILPGVFGGNTINPDYQGISANFHETYVYIGILPLLFALLSWRTARYAEVGFWWLVVLISGLLAFGGYTFFYELVQFLPGFNLFRVPARWLLMVNLGLALLAGWGFDTFLKRPAKSQLLLKVMMGVWLGLTVIIGLLWLWRAQLIDWADSINTNANWAYTLQLFLKRGLFEQGQTDHLMIVGLIAWLTIPAIGLIVKLGLAVSLLAAYSIRKIPGQFFVSAALVLTLLDLLVTGGTVVNPYKPASLWQELSAGARYVLEAEANNPERFMSLADSKAENAVASLGQYYSSIYQIHAASGHRSPLQLRRYTNITDLQNDLLVLALTGTRYLITNKYIPVNEQVPLDLAYNGDDGWFVYELRNSSPRAFIVHQAITAATSDESLELLQTSTFDPHRQVILETNTTPLLEPADVNTDEVVITEETSSSIAIQAQLTTNGYLVLLDNYYPGWQVYVDNQKQSLLLANHFARAVYLEAGNHTVSFVYRPLSLRIGLIFSGVGLIILAFSAWRLWVQTTQNSKANS